MWPAQTFAQKDNQLNEPENRHAVPKIVSLVPKLDVM